MSSSDESRADRGSASTARGGNKRKAGRAAPSTGKRASALVDRGAPRSERRFEPASSSAALLSVVGMSVGAVLAGAGTYGQWLRQDLGPYKYAPHLLGAGAVLLFAVALAGQWGARVLRVGDAGIAEERGEGEIERIAWNAVERLVPGAATLTVQASGRSISVPLASQGQAAARVVYETKRRRPRLLEGLDLKLPPVDETAGEVLALEPPQVAGLRCRESDRLIAFERDARLCGLCGELYHKDSVPRRCATCNAALRV